MNKWPLVNRNKVEDSKVSIPVRMIVEKEDLPEPLRGLAQSVNFWNIYVLFDTPHLPLQLLTHWESLPLYNRIPKRSREVSIHIPLVIL